MSDLTMSQYASTEDYYTAKIEKLETKLARLEALLDQVKEASLDTLASGRPAAHLDTCLAAIERHQKGEG